MKSAEQKDSSCGLEQLGWIRKTMISLQEVEREKACTAAHLVHRTKSISPNAQLLHLNGNVRRVSRHGMALIEATHCTYVEVESV